MPFVNNRGEQVDLVPPDTVPIDENNLSRDDLVTVENIAQLCWESHLTWERILGEPPRPSWCALAERPKEEQVLASVRAGQRPLHPGAPHRTGGRAT